MSLKFKPLKPFFPLHCQPTGWQYVGRLLELIVCDENEQVLDDGWQIENRSLTAGVSSFSLEDAQAVGVKGMCFSCI